VKDKLRLLILWLVVLILFSGCAMSEAQRRATIKGAIAGGVLGAGMAAGIVAGADFNQNWPAIPIGFAAGLVFGAILGYETAPETASARAMPAPGSAATPTPSAPPP
jgi:cytochrome bd-type quinol oxidase subunit 1